MFEDIDEAAKSLQCVIKTSFAVYDESINDMNGCTFGDLDENECTDKTQSCTQVCRCNNFQIGEQINNIFINTTLVVARHTNKLSECQAIC